MTSDNEPLKIGMIAPPWFAVPPSGYGGIERVVSYLTEGLIERGHQVTLFAAGGSKTKAELVSLFEAPPSKLIGDYGIEIAHVSAAYRRCGEFDLIHDHTIGGLGCAFMCDAPVAHTIHGPITEGASALYSRVAPPVHLIAISENQKSTLPMGVPAEVISNALPLADVPYSSSHGDYLLFVGRVNPEKGIVEAIEIARQVNKPLLLLVKINERPEQEYFDQVVKPRLKLIEADVRITPPEAEKQRAYRDALATLFPIQWPEPFGLVMIESMATGTPVIAFNRGSASEVIEHGKTGFVCASIDEAACAVAKIPTLNRADCRRRVEMLYSSDVAVQRHEAFYRRLVVNSGAARGAVHA